MKRILSLTLLSLVAGNVFGMDCETGTTNKSINWGEFNTSFGTNQQEKFTTGLPKYKRIGRYEKELEPIDPVLKKQVIQNAPEELKDMLRMIKVSFLLPKNFLPRACLLLGSSGTGKTLLAKSIAFDLKRPFYFIRAVNLLDQYKNCHQNIFSEMEPLLQAKNRPLVVVFDEVNALTDQYKNQHSSDQNTPNAFWSLLDDCKNAPHIFLVCTSNNNQSDFPEQIEDRFGRRVFTISKPNLQIRKDIISYNLNFLKHSLDDHVNELAEQLDGRTCREIKDIIEKACELALKENPTQNYTIELRHFNMAIDSIPIKPSKKDIAREFVTRQWQNKYQRMLYIQEHSQVIDDEKKDIDEYYRSKSSSQQDEQLRISRAQRDMQGKSLKVQQIGQIAQLITGPTIRHLHKEGYNEVIDDKFLRNFNGDRQEYGFSLKHIIEYLARINDFTERYPRYNPPQQQPQRNDGGCIIQ